MTRLRTPLNRLRDEQELASVREEVAELCSRFAPYPDLVQARA